MSLKIYTKTLVTTELKFTNLKVYCKIIDRRTLDFTLMIKADKADKYDTTFKIDMKFQNQ